MGDVLTKLQSRIDTNGYEISEAILFGYVKDAGKERCKKIYDDQALDKRLYGEIVRLRRLVSALCGPED